MIYLNERQSLFYDTKQYNSYVRLRRDHLMKLGLLKHQRHEIDFFAYLKWRAEGKVKTVE